MGAKVNKKMSYANSKIIDYATNNMRTDFLDIFLGSECLFWISTGSGIDNLSKCFEGSGSLDGKHPLKSTNFDALLNNSILSNESSPSNN